jgi:predicted alpha/beta hydrolase family esterase
MAGTTFHLEAMKASEADILMIPGHGDAGPDHWQNRWQSRLASARRVDQATLPTPASEDWVQSIANAINAAEKPVVLVAHSLGVGAAIHALAECEGKVAGAFFVSPPNLQYPGLMPRQWKTFGPYPRAPLAFPSITIASRNDPLGSYEHAGDIANAWGSLLVAAGHSGQIDVDSGHGPWPEGTMVFAQFLSRLKP